MNATQEHLLKLVLEIDTICKKYDIQYFIDYGSVIGAIRHEGFIPWDDDMDITLTEDNYNKWVAACKKELDPQKRAYSDVRLNREFPTVFGRYIDLETARIGERGPFWQNLCGQCIDVFYLLELPGDPVKKQKAIDLYFVYDEFSNISRRHFRTKTERWMKLYERCCFWAKIVGRERVLRHLEKRIFNHHYKDCDSYIVTSARKKGPTSIVPKDCYDGVHMANFEGHKLPVPSKYVEEMIVFFGDNWCMLPEHHKQHSKMSHTGIGCATYVADYMRYINKDQLVKDRWAFKNLDVEEGYRSTCYSKMYYKKLGSYEYLKIRQNLDKNNLDLDNYTNTDDPSKCAELDALFEEYYEKQLNSSPLYWEAYFNIGDDLLYLALYNLIFYRNDCSSAATILRLRELQDSPLTGKLRLIHNLISSIREVEAHLQYRRLEEAETCLQKELVIFPRCQALLDERLALLVMSAKNDWDYENCKQEANNLLNTYPNDEQAMKALGDIAWASKDLSAAQYYYDWIMSHSLNGMYHLDIKKKQADSHD